MLVQAKCVIQCYDSETGVTFYPGFEYPIDTESKLAQLLTIPVSFDDKGKPCRYYRDHEGNTKTMPVSKPPYAFEFDRNISKTAEGEIVTKDYSCKKCGVEFKTLAALGRHSNSFHKDDDLIKDDEPVQARPDGRRIKDKTFTCKQCGEVQPNLWALRVHKKSHEAREESVLALGTTEGSSLHDKAAGANPA